MEYTAQWTALEFDSIRQMLAEQAVSAGAREKLLQWGPVADEGKCLHRMAETGEARKVLESCGTPPLSAMDSLTDDVTLAQAGGMLLPEQLTAVARFATACRRLMTYLRRAESASPMIAAYAGEMRDVSALEERIETAVQEDGVRDVASLTLRSLRQRMAAQEGELKEKLNRLIKTQQRYLADGYVTCRQGRWVLPVQRRFQQQFPGTVVEASAKGGTIFMEPHAAASMQQALHTLRLAEDEEVRRLLYVLSDLVAAYGEQLSRNRRVMEELDMLFARAKLGAAMRGNTVHLSTEGTLALQGARHPLLPREQCVPLNLTLTEETRGVIITGPNTGGKTVTLKTVGLLTLMAQSGLQLPCDADSVLPLRDAVFCDIGDSQSLSQSLSTFSGHLVRVMEVLQHASQDSLVLLDELGSGTDPAEGMGIALAVLEELRRRGCLFLATTHDPQVKRYAEQAAHVLSARMAFDRESLRPLYRLELGRSGESCALFIAQRMGFPAALLTAAHQAAYDGAWQSQEEPPRLPVPRSGLKRREVSKAGRPAAFTQGDSVLVLPEKTVGLIYQPEDAQGCVVVQVQGEKRQISAKRVKLLVPASALYPPDYDYSIVFDTVANRKAAHTMARKFDRDAVIIHREGK